MLTCCTCYITTTQATLNHISDASDQSGPQHLAACRPASNQEVAPANAAASAASLQEALSHLQAGAYPEALDCALLATKLAPDR